MGTSTETIPEKSERTLRLRRPLVEINDYAAREGISVCELLQCSEIGIVQLRKHKGKTYVVDIPTLCYDNDSRADAEVAQLLKEASQSSHTETTRQTQPQSGALEPHTATKAKSPDAVALAKRIKNACMKLTQVSTGAAKTISNELRRHLKKHTPSQLPPKTISQDKKELKPTPTEPVDSGTIAELVRQMLAQSGKSDILQPPNSAKQDSPSQDACQPNENSKICPDTAQVIQMARQQLNEIERALATKTAPPDRPPERSESSEKIS